MGSKEDREFSKVLGVWTTKFCFAKGTLIVTRKSSIALLACGKVCLITHAQVYASFCESSPQRLRPLPTAHYAPV
jgi:hypothetical protein